MKAKLVEAIAQLVRTLSDEERDLLEAKLQQERDLAAVGAIARPQSALDLARPWVGCLDDGPEDLSCQI
ncbi:hypothetical protein KR51_00015730 [Rubidibacter lacunae KORDI 51-2]|uniref:Uncharacterized protein n=1 Tax=Rubidibacter lacunae KORDI 51-2 TaxID=582515 RepID=U5DLH4_9CHRO|nr:hypothetical protein [Rubidibacter lacunae]ERN41727.1 hypothetical protein KR51_00015730 [Rubidibacter lacunae KORDI 51-2]